jgi:hypothetical protein
VKLRPYHRYADGEPTDEIAGYHHWCPACNEPHGIAVGKPNRLGAKWSFNGDLERPTFQPSVRCFTTEKGAQRTLCHYFVTAGMIAFCHDNPHKLNGQTVPLPDWPDDD